MDKSCDDARLPTRDNLTIIVSVRNDWELQVLNRINSFARQCDVTLRNDPAVQREPGFFSNVRIAFTIWGNPIDIDQFKRSFKFENIQYI